MAFTRKDSSVLVLLSCCSAGFSFYIADLIGRLWPEYVIALNNLATITDNETDIETLLLKALHLDPSHTTSLFNLADLYRYCNRFSHITIAASLLLFNIILRDASYHAALLHLFSHI